MQRGGLAAVKAGPRNKGEGISKNKRMDEQSVAILKDVANGSPVLEVARNHNLQPETIYRWKET
ncbi:MAG: hypothetical protein C0473_00550 [Cyanobacteria bacterium DS3.002]|nr:hypothetical protein [Cyanobacteria bacterium DS3.002]MBA4049448.1 hypothetical protein [Cyanobacteria bacterium DS2.008]MBA4075020.1 hypothetical protein [Cyanobacteria bacterium PR.023]